MTADTLKTACEITIVRGDSPWRQAWRRLGQRPAALVGLAVILFFVGAALAAPLVSPHDPIATDWLAVRKAPSLRHLFGTDEIGRDVLSRVIWGARASLGRAHPMPLCDEISLRPRIAAEF